MPRILKDDHAGRLLRWVDAYPTDFDGAEALFPDLARVDPAQLPGMIEHLREAERSARSLRHRLEEHYTVTRPAADAACSGVQSLPPERVHGLDGKHYPRPVSAEVHDYLIGRAHYLRHADGLTVREIAKALADEGHRRSVGSVAAYLKVPCVECSGDADVSPEQGATDDL